VEVVKLIVLTAGLPIPKGGQSQKVGGDSIWLKILMLYGKMGGRDGSRAEMAVKYVKSHRAVMKQIFKYVHFQLAA
jgi:hypothetical protein